MDTYGSIAWWVNVAALLPAAIIDIRTRRIPNWLVAPFLGAGMIAHATKGWPEFAGSLSGVLLALAIFFVPCYLGGMGMGDLKLAAAVGAWIGPRQLATAIVLTAIAGAIIAVAYAARRGLLGASNGKTGPLNGDCGEAGGATQRSMSAAERARVSIPYAPAIAIGTLISFFAL